MKEISIEEIKELANKELYMYDLSEILDEAVLDFFFKYLYNNTKDN